MTDVVLETRDPKRARLIRLLQEDLRKRAIAFSQPTIEQVIDIYEARLAKEDARA